MADANPNARLEAFCDGVFAIALTLLIIDVKLPATASISSTADFWHALQLLAPVVFAFLLSFGIILITWVNHHAALELVNRSSASFIYANGFLLLTVVAIPFPTALLGAYLLTPYAAPAVVLLNCITALQAIAWVLMWKAVLKHGLARGERAAATARTNMKYGYFAFALYSLCAIVALWLPFAVAVATTLIWSFWLWLGISMKREPAGGPQHAMQSAE